VENCGRAREATYDNMVQCMCDVCWVIKTTDMHSEYLNIYCFSIATVVTRTDLIVLLYIHYLSCSFCFMFFGTVGNEFPSIILEK